MSDAAACIADPLTPAECEVLRAYFERNVADPRADWGVAAERLFERGMLERTKRGVLVTPEGLAALLSDCTDDLDVIRVPPDPKA